MSRIFSVVLNELVCVYFVGILYSPIDFLIWHSCLMVTFSFNPIKPTIYWFGYIYIIYINPKKFPDDLWRTAAFLQGNERITRCIFFFSWLNLIWQNQALACLFQFLSSLCMIAVMLWCILGFIVTPVALRNY